MISKGTKSGDFIDISQIRQADIAAYYLGIKSIPCLIKSPLRQDKRPSFSLFSNNGEEVGFIDYSTREHGSIIDLLMQMWHCDYVEAKRRIANDMGDCKLNISIGRGSYANRIPVRVGSGIDLQCKAREWRDYDLAYWESYGISLKWLKYADVYPISHKIVIKDNISYAFAADKYAYAYVEFKEGHTTLKIYQPFNKRGFKWANRHDRSVISLWTKVPKEGDRVCICSSLKDALCLWANTGIPALAIQGEGYGMSDTAINELKRRFKSVYILLDNDAPGLEDAKQLASKTGFTNIVLPQFDGGKDISDLYKVLHNKEQFKQTILSLFNNE
jgi:hypothetical protein